MGQSQFLELLRTLKPAEKEQILLFAANPYFNNGRFKTLIIPLLEYCLAHLAEESEQIFEKSKVYATLFPAQEYIEGKVEKLMVEAHKILRSFLLAQHYFREENDFHQTLHFSEIVRSRGLEERHQQLITRLQKKQAEEKHKDYLHNFKQIELETSIHYTDSLNNQKKGDLNIPKLLETIEAFYHLRRVALLSRFLLQQRIAVLEPPEIILSNLAYSDIPQHYLDASPALHLYAEVLNILKKDRPELQDVQALSDLLQQYETALNWETLQEFYTYLRNFCVLILLTEPENEEIMNLLHETYINNLDRGFLHYEGKLVPSRYKAIVDNALNLKAYDWANDFIEKYKTEIYGTHDTEDIYLFNKALYLFAIGDYSACLDFVPDTSPLPDYLIQGKRLEIKALYELGSELLPYRLDAFKMFLSRNSSKILSPTYRQKNQDFANLMHQLINSTSYNKARVEVLIKRIQEKKQAAEWRWLLEKAQNLKTN